MIKRGGWFYDYHRTKDQIIAEKIWFPLSPSRSSVFVHLDLINDAAVLLSECLLSAEMIVKFIEKSFSTPPPERWRRNFFESLKHYMAWKLQIKHGNAEDHIRSGQIACRTICGYCHIGPYNRGTVITVFKFNYCLLFIIILIIGNGRMFFLEKI